MDSSLGFASAALKAVTSEDAFNDDDELNDFEMVLDSAFILLEQLLTLSTEVTIFSIGFRVSILFSRINCKVSCKRQ